jgi:hypothetical protein
MSVRFRIGLLYAASTLMVATMLPRPAMAMCGMDHIRGCFLEMQYGVFLNIAVVIWSFDRALLVLAYQLDQLRWWVAAQAFSAAYESIRLVAEPLLNPLASLAIVVGCVLFLLVPIFGRIELVSIRQILLWVVLGPLLMAQAGTWLIILEQERMDIGAHFATEVGKLSAEGIFGPPVDDPKNPFPEPTAIYPLHEGESPCRAGHISRPRRIGMTLTPQVLHADDLAAGLLLANAQDIHCPGEDSPSYDLPDGFYTTGAYAANALDISQPNEEKLLEDVQKIQRGITRLLLGAVACLLAVLEMAIHLLFALSLVVVWLALPLVVLIGLFTGSQRSLGKLVQQTAQIMLASWMVSLMLGLMLACLTAAAKTQNITAVVSLSIGGLLLALRLLILATGTFGECITGVTTLLGSGASATLASGTAAASSLANRVTQSVKAAGATAATAGLAYRATGNARYATGAALGRMRPIARVGAVAAGFGMVDEEWQAGFASGERAADRGLAEYARAIPADVKRPLQDGITLSERAMRRTVARQLAAAQRPTVLQQAEELAAYIRTNQVAQDLSAARQQVLNGIQRGRASLARAARSIPDIAGAITDPARIAGAVEAAIGDAAQSIYAADSVRRPETRAGMASRLKPGTRAVVWLPRQTPPADAQTFDATRADRAALMAQGYTLQSGDDPATLVAWRDPAVAPGAAGASQPAGAPYPSHQQQAQP